MVRKPILYNYIETWPVHRAGFFIGAGTGVTASLMSHPTKGHIMQFQKGQSGNPAGRPRGSRNKSTTMLEKIVTGEGQATCDV